MIDNDVQQLNLPLLETSFRRLKSTTSSNAAGCALHIHSLELDSPSNKTSVGFFPVNVTNKRIPKLQTSPILETVPVDPYSVANIQ